jgi:hypothetical protein
VKSKKVSSPLVVKVASISRNSSRFPVMTAQVGVSQIERAAKARSGSEKGLVAAKPAPKGLAVMPAKPMATAKSRSQLKTTGAGPKPNAGRIAKASSTPDKSKLRVAEGERRRSS